MQNLRIFYTWAPGKPPEQVGKSRKKLQPDPFHCTKRVTASLQMPASSLLLPNLFPILLTPRYSYSPSLTLYPDTCVLRWGKLGTWRSQLFPPTEESSRIPPDPSPHGDRGCVHAESKAEAIQRGAPIYPIQAWVCPSGRPRTSLMPFAHQGQAQWEPHPALPAPPQHCHLGAGLSFLSPSGSRGSLSGPRAVQRVLCLGWKQLFSPLWKHGLCLIIKLSEAGSKGTAVLAWCWGLWSCPSLADKLS